MAFIMLSNLGASVAEVVGDALVAEFSRTHSPGELQSYAFTALAAGTLSGNLLGGLLLLKFPKASTIFFIFLALLTIQLALSLATKEISFYQPSNHHLHSYSLKENLSKQFTDLITVISERSIFYPLLWITASNSVVPLLSGTIFFFQTRHLNLDPLVIGLSKVIGQVMVLCTTLLYNVRLKGIPMRTLISMVQLFTSVGFSPDQKKGIVYCTYLPTSRYLIAVHSLSAAIPKTQSVVVDHSSACVLDLGDGYSLSPDIFPSWPEESLNPLESCIAHSECRFPSSRKSFHDPSFLYSTNLSSDLCASSDFKPKDASLLIFTCRFGP
ncbi:hypothetical protein KSP40_PGU000936 [Platanthera guangdongensis]|uniref:Uncharacterized protein n=1 Tax=Platanthera guangdongensis TaxID=2320717 RepID=A0ABR2M190_9ASPA